MVKRFIRDLKEKEHILSPYLVTEKNTGNDRNGKPFMSLTVADNSGHVNARMFEKVEEASPHFEIGDVVMLKGFVQLFQNRKQVLVHEVRKATDDEYKMNDMVAELGGDPRLHFAELLKMIDKVKSPFVKLLLQNTLADEKLKEILLNAPAAKTIHHAYRGGLLEHIRSIAGIMEALSEHYSFLDRDYLIFGAIYHDIGKIFELDLTQGIRYTQSGRLVGHMALACEMIDQQVAKIPEFPIDVKDVLKHIVLSHHGKLEYGSPKLPMMPEAIVVAMIDELDSRMNTLFHFLKNETQNLPPTEKWSHYHPGFERYFFLDFFRQRQAEQD